MIGSEKIVNDDSSKVKQHTRDLAGMRFSILVFWRAMMLSKAIPASERARF
jgi:hypothetical protein